MSESTKLKNIDIVHKAEAERLLKKVSLTVNLCMPEVKTAKEENILLCENLNLFDNNTCCCVKKKKIIILNNISCSIKPGMTAIMGMSGSGKTSLLNCLANRLDENFQCDPPVHLNDKVLSKDFRFQCGYVTQKDQLISSMTVKENVEFSANLRLNNTKKLPKKQLIEKLLSDLILKHISNRKVGSCIKSNISNGERKRVAIAIEMVTSPNFLYLDEPTSGIDAAFTHKMIKILYNSMGMGNFIIMSIHQPRYSVFKQFDHVIFLSKGRLIYEGSPDKAIHFFKSFSKFQCNYYSNIADDILDYIYKCEMQDETDENKSCIKSIEEKFKLSEPTKEKVATVFKRKDLLRFSAPFLTQIKMLSKKELFNMFENKHVINGKFMGVILLSLIIAFIFYPLDYSYKSGIQNRSGLLFFIVIYQIFINSTCVNLFISDYNLFIYHRISGYFRVSTYLITKYFVGFLPLKCSETLLFSLLIYFIPGLKYECITFFIFYVTVLMVSLCAANMAIYIGAATNNYIVSTVLSSTLWTLMMIFGGHLLNLNHIKWVIAYAQYLSIFRYGYNTLLVNELGNVVPSIITNLSQNATIIISDKYNLNTNNTIQFNVLTDNYLKSQGLFLDSLSYNYVYVNIGILCAVSILFLLLTYKSLRNSINYK